MYSASATANTEAADVVAADAAAATYILEAPMVEAKISVRLTRLQLETLGTRQRMKRAISRITQTRPRDVKQNRVAGAARAVVSVAECMVVGE